MTYYYIHSEPSSSTLWFAVRLLLLTISASAYTLWALARYQLGRSLAFGVTTDGPFVTTGLYSKFTNPIYLFGTIALTSYLLLINRPIWLCILIVMLPMQYIRAQREARALLKKYDDRYEAYLASVWF
jgi:protein-S-isoprenylcysteine O-methyltransferase Ste14